MKTIEILIPKGTEIHSTHPTRNKIVSARTQTVDNIFSKRDYLEWCDKIEWAGAGGYWRWATINDEILDVNPELKKWVEKKREMEND